MSKRRISCDQFSASDLELFVDSIEEISRLEGLKNKRKRISGPLDIEDAEIYSYEEDILSTTYNLSSIYNLYDEMMSRTFDADSIGRNSTCLVPNVYPSAPEINSDEYAEPNVQLDAVEISIHSEEIESIEYAEPTIATTEVRPVQRYVPIPDLDAIEYADDLPSNNNIIDSLPFDCTGLALEEDYESLYINRKKDDSHTYQELNEPLVKKKRSKLSKLNIFGLIRKKYKKYFPNKTYGWVKSTSWTRMTVV